MPGIFMRLRRLQKERILKNYVKLFVKMLTPLYSRNSRNSRNSRRCDVK